MKRLILTCATAPAVAGSASESPIAPAEGELITIPAAARRTRVSRDQRQRLRISRRGARQSQQRKRVGIVSGSLRITTARSSSAKRPSASAGQGVYDRRKSNGAGLALATGATTPAAACWRVRGTAASTSTHVSAARSEPTAPAARDLKCTDAKRVCGGGGIRPTSSGRSVRRLQPDALRPDAARAADVRELRRPVHRGR